MFWGGGGKGEGVRVKKEKRKKKKRGGGGGVSSLHTTLLQRHVFHCPIYKQQIDSLQEAQTEGQGRESSRQVVQ